MTTPIFENGRLARRPLGNTNLMVTSLRIGCAPLGDMPETFAYDVPQGRALDTIRATFNSQINFLDTAYS